MVTLGPVPASVGGVTRSAKRPLLLVALILLVVLGWILWPVAAAVMTGGYVVLIAARPFERLVTLVRGRRSLAAGLATSAIVLVVGGLVALAVEESIGAVPWLQGALEDQGGVQGLAAHLPQPLQAALPALSRAFLGAAGGLLAAL